MSPNLLGIVAGLVLCLSIHCIVTLATNKLDQLNLTENLAIFLFIISVIFAIIGFIAGLTANLQSFGGTLMAYLGGSLTTYTQKSRFAIFTIFGGLLLVIGASLAATSFIP